MVRPRDPHPYSNETEGVLEIGNNSIFDLTVERLKPMIETRRMSVDNSLSRPLTRLLGAFPQQKEAHTILTLWLRRPCQRRHMMCSTSLRGDDKDARATTEGPMMNYSRRESFHLCMRRPLTGVKAHVDAERFAYANQKCVSWFVYANLRPLIMKRRAANENNEWRATTYLLAGGI